MSRAEGLDQPCLMQRAPLPRGQCRICTFPLRRKWPLERCYPIAGREMNGLRCTDPPEGKFEFSDLFHNHKLAVILITTRVRLRKRGRGRPLMVGLQVLMPLLTLVMSTRMVFRPTDYNMRTGIAGQRVRVMPAAAQDAVDQHLKKQHGFSQLR